MTERKCLECGSPLESVAGCRDYLNEMIKWDFEDFTGVGKVHHLTVLSYNLQHPSLYSPKGLEDAKASLQEFFRHPESFNRHNEWNKKKLASNVRDWKITGTSENHGVYVSVPTWKITASDVVRAGLPHYVENVKAWTDSVLKSLIESGNIDSTS
ncbi:MAG: uncharacterized protein JWO50_644 [Candidatus Kaiserbacteria bacterium]|nr:uncharacterized protein [Candidatus Kaiserbacteria bacterium]